VWPLFEMVAPLSSGSKSAANWGSPLLVIAAELAVAQPHGRGCGVG
jgi:hypothetical protein